MDLDTACSRWEMLWNEADAERRVELAGSFCREDVELVDPGNQVRGAHGLSDAVARTRARMPGLTFRLTGRTDSHHNVVRLWWESASQDGSLTGIDVLVFGEDGRVAQAIGFMDQPA
ncbi:nuclear transport factor 2 family protein [Actinomadura barringtoniae]|uniref:Nuclear transport factor 2 family protein n=1 Tax=Actinomadura barringtoniae TaxID=1427535 RepID=A0A939PIM9_9ACTN|nr:nuclear transport factor 2 family protein [Actinomadura barringtoniae]MBO2453416.1 nuclear transport factor 2 family protein [Actinomadura barringtoniae]